MKGCTALPLNMFCSSFVLRDLSVFNQFERDIISVGCSYQIAIKIFFLKVGGLKNNDVQNAVWYALGV
jgi:hypothetical protein